MLKQKLVYVWAWPPPARSAYNRDAWSALPLVMRTLVVPECDTVESSDADEPGDVSTSHCASDPDSKSSAKYVPAATPDPKRLTACGLSSALSFSVRAALRGPSALGAKVTETEQLAPAFSEAGQLFV